MRYTPEDIRKNNSVYRVFMNLGCEDGWEYQDKLENFKILSRIAEYTHHPLSHSTVLDVGCGTGDLYGYLEKKRLKKYVGVDIFDEAVEKARLKYPSGHFEVGDFLELDLERFDYVFCSGALTTHLMSDNYRILESWISKMWSLANAGVAFNLLLQDYWGQSDKTSLFFYDRYKVLELCSALPNVQVQTVITDAGSADELREMHVFLYYVSQ